LASSFFFAIHSPVTPSITGVKLRLAVWRVILV
jgi:hypothetical protein